MNSNMHIRFNSCSYEYRPGVFKPKVYGIKNLTLEVAKGEAFGFLGHNGAGKTTSIKCLMGLQNPTHGSVEIAGVDSRIPSSRARVGFLPEQPYFYDQVTIHEILSFFAGLSGIPSGEIPGRIKEVLTLVNLYSRRDSKLRTLSKGLLQRVGLSQALLSNPELLVLDEPFSGLDPIGRREFREIFQGLKAKGVTLFISSHILSDVEALCTRAAILVKGELKKIVDLTDKNSFGAERVFLRAKGLTLPEGGEVVAEQTRQYRAASMVEANKMLSDILQKGGTVEELLVERDNLEDIFIQTVSKNS